MPHPGSSYADRVLACPAAAGQLQPGSRGVPGNGGDPPRPRQPWESALPVVENDSLCPPIALFYPGHFTADCALLGGYPGPAGVCRGVPASGVCASQGRVYDFGSDTCIPAGVAHSR